MTELKYVRAQFLGVGGNRFILLLIEQVVAVPERLLLCSHRYLVKIHVMLTVKFKV